MHISKHDEERYFRLIVPGVARIFEGRPAGRVNEDSEPQPTALVREEARRIRLLYVSIPLWIRRVWRLPIPILTAEFANGFTVAVLTHPNTIFSIVINGLNESATQGL